jgi:site-specific recombinase
MRIRFRSRSAKPAATRGQRRWDLTALLNAADIRAPRPYRHLWLIRLAEWIRSPAALRDANDDTDAGVDTSWPVRRIRHLLNVLDRNPAQREQIATLLSTTLNEVDDQGLWADFGFAPRSAFLSELSERLRRLFLPSTPDTTDLGTLFRLVFTKTADADWIAAVDEPTLQRIAQLLNSDPNTSRIAHWPDTVADAVQLLASQIRASGFSALMRQRMDETTHTERPFHALSKAVEQLDQAIRTGDEQHIMAEIVTLQKILEKCRYYTDTIYGHLNDYGISIDVIFEIHQLRERTFRIDALLLTLTSPQTLTPIAKLVSDMVRADHGRTGIRALFAHHYSMLAHKVAQRSGDIGEHYITTTRRDYFDMLRQALIGGAILAATTFLKFLLTSLGLSLFWAGWVSGANYAISFVVIYLLHGVVATKQPAMTAAALAARLEHINDDGVARQRFVAEVAKLIRSQFAGIVGNLLAVAPVVLGIQLLAWNLYGAPAVNVEQAMHILHHNTLLGPTVIYAAITGIILFIGSLIAGWTENWFIWHRLDSAIAWNPRFIAVLGAPRAQRWSNWWRHNISGMASNIALGMMLGLVPISAQFFGLPLDVRHVTLVTGQVAAAAGTLGTAVLYLPQFWWCIAAIPLIAVCNLGVSFTLAFRVALRSRGIEVKDRKLVVSAVLHGMRRDLGSFLYPTRKSTTANVVTDDQVSS